MDVAVEIFFEVRQPRKESAICIACINRRLITTREFMQTRESLPCILMFVDHTCDWALKAHRGSLSPTHRRDSRKENLLLLHHVTRELRLKAAIDLKNLYERWGMPAVNVSDTLGHRMETWKFPTKEVVVYGDNILGQFVRRKSGRVCNRRGLVSEFSFELLDHGLQRNVFALACIAQRAASLAAKVDLKRLEDARTTGPLGNQFAHRAFGDRGSFR